MKKIFAILVAVLSVLSLSAKTIYFTPGTWDVDNPSYFVHTWGNSASTQMLVLNGSIYTVDIPDGNTSAIFVRAQSGLTEPDWDKEWNRQETTIPSDKNHYTITDWSAGSWSTYVAPDPDAKFYITGEGEALGNWDTKAIKSTTDKYTLSLAAGTYQLKVTVDGTWGTAKGFDDLTETADGLYKAGNPGDNNIGFELKAAGDVDVTYTSTVFKLEGDFYVKPVAKYYATGDSALVVDGGFGIGKKWKSDAIPVYKDTLVLEGLKANQEYKLKVTVDGTWETAKGYSHLTTLSNGLSVDGDNNIIFTLTDAGNVTVVYNSEVFKVLGSFKEPAFDPATQSHLKLVPYRWAQANAKMAVYTWGKKVDGKWSAFFTGEGDTLQTVIPQAADSMVLVRFNSDVTAPTWENEGENVWNKIDKILIDKEGLTYTIKTWDEGTWESYAPPVPVNKTVKFVPSEEWLEANAKFAAWTWGAEQDGTWSSFFSPISSGNDTLSATIKTSADSIAFVRFSPKAKAPTWEQETESEVLVWGEVKDTIDWKGLTATVVGWTELSWKPVEHACESYGLLINGVYREGKRNVLQSEWLEYKLLNVDLKAGDKLQVHYDCGDGATWVISTFAEGSYTFDISEGKYIVDKDGSYDFYLKLIPDADEIYISKAGFYTKAVPDQCEAVLMQAFYNESYSNSASGVGSPWNLGNTKWETLITQADTLGKYFDYIWLPPSASGDGMGYHPKNYGNQSSNWGSKEELADLISALHDAGSKVVADVVINHCQSSNGWLGFPTFDFGSYGSFNVDSSWICKNDEVNADWNKDKAGSDWGKATGNYDDGENWEGARDWAHDMPKVQEMFKAYLQWLREEVGYDGFRYDKGDGFNNWHHDNYNKAAGPEIAFMECYSGTDEIWGRIQGANYNLMALDFDTKWHVFDAIAGWDYDGKYGNPRGDGLLGRNNGRYAVEFIDSHDWFLRGDNENEFGGRGNSLTEDLKCRLLQANAFMLSMPCVPCVFYPHWKKYDGFIKPMIQARKLAGVHSESAVTHEYATSTGYQATIVGKYGYLILCLGDKAHQNFVGYTCMASYYETNDCNQGKDASYQIWVQRTTPLPTDIEQTENEPAMRAEKFMKNGKMYIRLGDKVYDVLGQTIK